LITNVDERAHWIMASVSTSLYHSEVTSTDTLGSSSIPGSLGSVSSH
jgi:hypothetical protein